MAYFPPYIDETGIHMPTYEERLQDLLSAYRSIFGQEAELSPAVPDYQLLSVVARALDDTSALVVSAFNSRNPAYASGCALDLLLPQVGLVREPGESDASARARMNRALIGNGIFTLEAMESAIRAIPNVTHVLIRVNDTDAAADGIPPHTIAAYVNNGNAGKIAEAIFAKKPPGIGTYGSVSREVPDGRGNTTTISFSRVMLRMLQVHITLKAYEGFDGDTVKAAMTAALDEYVNREMDIGEPLNVPQLYGILYRAAGDLAPTFAVTDLYITGSGTNEREKLTPAWNAKFSLNSSSAVIYEVVSEQ